VQHAATKPETATPARDPNDKKPSDGPVHVTMLLVLTNQAGNSPPDKVQSNPIVCIGDICYLSEGSANPAKTMPRAAAMEAKNTALGLPGACQGRTSCVFRDVTLPPDANLQVIDAGFARAEPYPAIDARADKTCAIAEEDLDCEQPVSAKDYRLWLVPETVAQKAKVAQIEDALSTGLNEDNTTRDDDK
jgi:hypothetical protein